jgi:mycoredoxin
MQKIITIYSTRWCGDCRNAKLFLRRHNVLYSEIDIDRDEQAERKVLEWSGGRRVIPTFAIYDEAPNASPGILHNPRLHALGDALGLKQ